MATDPITKVVATENQTMSQVPSFAVTQTMAPIGHGKEDIQAVSIVEAWKYSDFLCQNYVMNGLTDSLYNVYTTMKTAKELWESLDRKYKTKDAGAKKFIVGRFLDYKMVDLKTVISQIQKLQVILHEIHAEGMSLSETFQVAAIIEKLPPAWKDFKNYLKHKRKKKFLEKYYNCDRVGHRSLECMLPKRNNKKEVNMVDDIANDMSEMSLVAVISKVNLVGSNPREWWIDTGATRHVC
ncbi:zinc knuckle (CCHC-type) family protein [Abeliophyllum distichum]|uniref:Zinc knuckle (CCHC-type) family protein n=1 Tax=Abeliophyllum distichum TaxID=126358 RepID=A0ABD1RF37_9LAMI